LKSPDSKVEMKGVHLNGEALAVGVATAVVDASVEDCASHEFSGLSNRKAKKSLQKVRGANSEATSSKKATTMSSIVAYARTYIQGVTLSLSSARSYDSLFAARNHKHDSQTNQQPQHILH